MTIQFGILLHSNMPFTWAYEPALHSSYRPVAEITLSQDLPINFHWAGPLSQMMNWRHPEVIKTIREGIATEKFELLGSAYAQNVMEITSDWANTEQIQYNREVLQSIYGISPRGFWNPERVWDNRFAKLLVDNGYEHTLIERRILNPENPESANRLYAQKMGTNMLRYLPDDQNALSAFDTGIWTGDSSKIIQLLERYQDEGRKQVVYAQDTEAIGFWQIAHQKNPKVFQENFRTLLKALADNSWIEVSHLSDMAMDEPIMVDRLGKGQATWMEDSVRVDGYKDYFSYLEESPEIHYYDEQYRKVEEDLKHAAGTGIDQLAKKVYLKSQFEFGCAPGSMGGDHTRYLLNVPGQMTWESLHYANRLLNRSKGENFRWVNSNGHPLVEWTNSHWQALVSPYGARIVQLIRGDTMISPSPFFYNRSGNIHELDHPSPKFTFKEYGTEMIYGGTLFEDQITLDGQRQGVRAQVETIRSSEGAERKYLPSLAHTHYNTQLIPFVPEIKTWVKMGDTTMLKRIRLEEEIRVNYTITSREQTHDISLEVSNELAPDPSELLEGRLQLDFSDSKVSNGKTTCELDMGSDITYKRSMFAGRVIGRFSAHVSPENPWKIELKLRVT